MNTPPPEQLRQTLDKMVEAGWATSFEVMGGKLKVQWTEDGEAAIEAAWSLMEDLGGGDAPEGTWNAMGYLMKLRHYGADATI